MVMKSLFHAVAESAGALAGVVGRVQVGGVDAMVLSEAVLWGERQAPRSTEAMHAIEAGRTLVAVRVSIKEGDWAAVHGHIKACVGGSLGPFDTWPKVRRAGGVCVDYYFFVLRPCNIRTNIGDTSRLFFPSSSTVVDAQAGSTGRNGC